MGASVNAKSALGRTPLDIAMEKENMPVIQYLTSVGNTGTAKQPHPFTLGLGVESPPCPIISDIPSLVIIWSFLIHWSSLPPLPEEESVLSPTHRPAVDGLSFTCVRFVL